MRIRCDRSEMVEKLGLVAGIVPSNSPKPILYDFLLEAGKEGMQVQASDLDVAGLIRIERVEVLEEGAMAIPADKLISIFREIPPSVTGVVIEEVPEMHGADLRADGYEFKLFGNDPSEFPRIAEIQSAKKFTISRETFAASLKRVAVAVSRDESRYQLGGVFFEAKGGKLTLTATDGKRLTNDQIKIEDGKDEVNAIVPNRAVDAILKMLGSPGAGDDTFALGFTDTDVLVKTDVSQLNAKLIEGTYPNYRNALPKDCPIKVKIKRQELLSAAKGAQLVSDTMTSTVIFRFDGDGLHISSQAKDVGEGRIQIKASVEKGPLEIRFNPSFVIDALRCIEDEEVRLEFQSSDLPGVIRGVSTPHYRHMIMPLVFEKKQ